MKRLLFPIVACAAIFSALPAFGAASRAEQAKQLVGMAATTLDNFMADKELPWFHDNLKKAKAVIIFPRVLKAGFFWGGSGGNGVLVVRSEKTGEWSQPAFYSIGSVSYGLQVGGEEAEVIMLAMSEKAVDSLYASSFKFGGDLSVAAGPRGAGAKKVLTADFISFARARGLYAGLNLEGSGIRVRADLNKAYYGRQVRPVQILVERTVRSADTEKLHQALKRAGI